MLFRSRLLGVTLLAALGCASAPEPAPSASGVPVASSPTEPSLYARLGEKPGIERVVATFVRNVGRDERINARFSVTDLEGLRGHLVDQICAGTGGPCTYRGRSMKTVHTGMDVRPAEFDAMGEDLVAACRAEKVPEREQHELVALIASMRGDIVGNGMP